LLLVNSLISQIDMLRGYLVEYFDPHDVYKLIAPGLVPRLPLRNLHWQSHAGPLRSIDTLHIELIPASAGAPSITSPAVSPNLSRQSLTGGAKDDGFQTQNIGAAVGSVESLDTQKTTTRPSGKERRHQIPGLRRTPYLKVLLVRCDDNDTYKSKIRTEIREWIKENTPPSQSTRKASTQENHDAFEWLVVHVVIPNTVAATQPRSLVKGSESSATEKTTSRWRSGTSSLLEKLRADFNGTSKGAIDRIAQIRIGINDVPYDMLPRVVPAVPTGYTETDKDSENAWSEFLGKFKALILSSFDMRVGQYEEDIKEKDAQRALPGWNFCTFFILKEGLARGFESVGLVEDALVGYDELSVGLDSIIHEQAVTGSPESHGGALLEYTEDIKILAERALIVSTTGHDNVDEEEAVDLQSGNNSSGDQLEEIPISPTKKQYREMILANNVSVFDFRCYIFARQISLLLRLANASSTREELLAKLTEQQESVFHGVAPQAPPPKPADESENLSMLAEICRRTLEFIPVVTQVLRKDIIAALNPKGTPSAEDLEGASLDSAVSEVADNMVMSFTFSITQQVLAQTSSRALPIPMPTYNEHEPKASIPEPKTMMHPARTSSLQARPNTQPPISPGIFPGPGQRELNAGQDTNGQFLKAGLEELAARRAELYALSRNILEESGKKRGWSDGWDAIPMIKENDDSDLEEVSLNDDDITPTNKTAKAKTQVPSQAGIDNKLLRTALDDADDFYRLYETLTHKSLNHYNLAGHIHAAQANWADLAVLKFHLGDYGEAAKCFFETTPFFGERGWSLLEVSMLIIHAKCLKELQREEDYVCVVITLLTKTCFAEKEKLNNKSAIRNRFSPRNAYPDISAIAGFVENLLSITKDRPKEVRVPLSQFFTNVQVEDSPQYHEAQDSFSLNLSLWSLLPDSFEINHATLRMTSTTGAAVKDITLETSKKCILKPGQNMITVDSKVSSNLFRGVS
jgi:trafficking protein particle complex subunit 10